MCSTHWLSLERGGRAWVDRRGDAHTAGCANRALELKRGRGAGSPGLGAPVVDGAGAVRLLANALLGDPAVLHVGQRELVPNWISLGLLRLRLPLVRGRRVPLGGVDVRRSVQRRILRRGALGGEARRLGWCLLHSLLRVSRPSPRPRPAGRALVRLRDPRGRSGACAQLRFLPPEEQRSRVNSKLCAEESEPPRPCPGSGISNTNGRSPPKTNSPKSGASHS